MPRKNFHNLIPAKNKIKEAGGISFSIPELITKYPEGNGVKIIVG